MAAPSKPGIRPRAHIAPAAALFVTSGEAFLGKHALRDEVVGPASLPVACRDMEQLLAITESLEGQLTATLQMDAGAGVLSLPLLLTLGVVSAASLPALPHCVCRQLRSSSVIVRSRLCRG